MPNGYDQFSEDMIFDGLWIELCVCVCVRVKLEISFRVNIVLL